MELAMIKSGRSLRLARLLKGQDTPLSAPMDHTVTDGPFADAQNYDILQTTLADNGADAIVVHKGRLPLLNGSVYAKLSIVVHVSASTKYASDPNFKYQVGDAEDCLRRGADAVSVHVNLGSATEDQQIRAMASVADSCDRSGLPLLAMIYPRGAGIKDHAATDTLRHAAALAVDLGADIVKLPLSGSAAEMRRVIDWCPIPVLAAGGSASLGPGLRDASPVTRCRPAPVALRLAATYSWRRTRPKKCAISVKSSTRTPWPWRRRRHWPSYRRRGSASPRHAAAP